VQLICGAQRGSETERRGERLGPGEIRLFELEPENVLDLDDRVGRAPWMLAPQGALLTVQPIVGADDMSAHCGSSPLTDDIVIYEHSLSQLSVMIISLLRVRPRADVVVAATPL